MKPMKAIAAVVIAGAGFTTAYAQEDAAQAETAVDAVKIDAVETLAEPDASLQLASVEEDGEKAEWVGKKVYDSNRQEVGAIENIIEAEDGSKHAVLSVGTFLGLGEKKITIPASELVAFDEGGVAGFATAMTYEQIEAAPAYIAEEPAEAAVEPQQ